MIPFPGSMYPFNSEKEVISVKKTKNSEPVYKEAQVEPQLLIYLSWLKIQSKIHFESSRRANNLPVSSLHPLPAGKPMDNKQNKLLTKIAEAVSAPAPPMKNKKQKLLTKIAEAVSAPAPRSTVLQTRLDFWIRPGICSW